jgi:hypothetical protein
MFSEGRELEIPGTAMQSSKNNPSSKHTSSEKQGILGDNCVV